MYAGLPMPLIQTRRRFLTGLSMAGAAGLFHTPPSQAAEGVLETTTVRIGKIESICLAPQYAGEELLRAEGFTEIHYVEVSPIDIPQAIGRGEADFSTTLAVDLIHYRCRRTDCRPRRGPCRLLRVVRQAECPPPYRAEGQAGGGGRPAAVQIDGCPGWSRSGQGYRLGLQHRSRVQPARAVCTR